MAMLYDKEIQDLQEEYEHYSFVEVQLRQEHLSEQADFMKARCDEISLAIHAMRDRHFAALHELEGMSNADRAQIFPLLHEQLTGVARAAQQIGCPHLSEYILWIGDRILADYT